VDGLGRKLNALGGRLAVKRAEFFMMCDVEEVDVLLDEISRSSEGASYGYATGIIGISHILCAVPTSHLQ
jgi:hypothetical protein